MKNIFNSKRIRYGTSATVITVLFIVIVLLINALVSSLTAKFPQINLDLTENKMFSISDITKEAIGNTNIPVNIKIVYNSDESDTLIEEYLDRYKQIKNSISIEKINISKNPAVANKYSGIDPYGSVIFENNEKYEVVSFMDLYGETGEFENAESLITNGILSVTKGEKKNLVFTSGHNEDKAYVLENVAKSNFYNISYLDTTKEAIKDCDLLVIYCPKTDFSPVEITDIENYVKDGGHLEIYLSPYETYLSNLCEYIKEWGIEVKEDVIYEKNTEHITRQGSTIPLVESNEYTKNINQTLYYDFSFKLEDLYSNINGITIKPVLTSSSIADTMDRNSGEIKGNIGKHNISLICERYVNDDKISKMYVSGTSMAYSGEEINNKDIALSVISGILPTESYVDIPLKLADENKFIMTETNIIFLILIIIIISASLIVFGIFVWNKRRKL